MVSLRIVVARKLKRLEEKLGELYSDVVISVFCSVDVCNVYIDDYI